jgi:hypothetical protein
MIFFFGEHGFISFDVPSIISGVADNAHRRLTTGRMGYIAIHDGVDEWAKFTKCVIVIQAECSAVDMLDPASQTP